MKELPISFISDSIRAIRAGRKTRTRRVFALRSGDFIDSNRLECHDMPGGYGFLSGKHIYINPFSRPGITRWVQEGYKVTSDNEDDI